MNFLVILCEFSFHEVQSLTLKLFCVHSVILGNTVPSGKDLGLGRCATAPEELSATSSSLSAYEQIRSCHKSLF